MRPGQEPLITFYRFLPGLSPRRATYSAAGTLPTRAFQYCEPARLASAFGYYVFLPLSFQLEWDGGTGGLWSFDDGAEWYPLTSAAFPDSMDAFDAIAPEPCQGFCPPFLGFTETHAVVQVWTGWFARTAPRYSLLVRGPANITRPTSYEVLEGIVETDHWFGPLFANLRINQSGLPIAFEANRPFLQVQPIHRDAYTDDLLNRFATREAKDIPPDLWVAYDRSLIEPATRNPERGHYAKEVRRRRAAETER